MDRRFWVLMDMDELEATRRLQASDHTAHVAGAAYIVRFLFHLRLEKSNGPVIGVTDRSQTLRCCSAFVSEFARWH